MSTFIGIAAAVISGVLNGSFAAPMKLNVKWEWENTWLLYSISALIVFPVIIVLLTVPGLLDIYRDTAGSVLVRTFLFGFGWGLGAVTFGLGLYMVGLSLGYTVMIGVIAVTGALIPMLVHNPGSLLTAGGKVIISAMLVTIGGVTLCGTAGVIREKGNREQIGEQKKQYKFKLGFLICLVSGVLSAMLNLAFDFGAPIAEAARNHIGVLCTDFRANNAVWFMALLGGFVPNLVYCGYLLLYKKSWKKYAGAGTGLYWFRAFLMGAIWICCIMLYGAGASRLGKMGTTVGWLIMMAVAVLIGNLWGVITGEWKAAPRKAQQRMVQGLLLLIGSVILVGFGKFLLD